MLGNSYLFWKATTCLLYVIGNVVIVVCSFEQNISASWATLNLTTKRRKRQVNRSTKTWPIILGKVCSAKTSTLSRAFNSNRFARSWKSSLSENAEKLADSAKKIIRKIKVFRDEGEASKCTYTYHTKYR